MSYYYEKKVKKIIKSIRLDEGFMEKVEAFIKKYNAQREMMRYRWNQIRFGSLVRKALEAFMKKKEEEWNE